MNQWFSEIPSEALAAAGISSTMPEPGGPRAWPPPVNRMRPLVWRATDANRVRLTSDPNDLLLAWRSIVARHDGPIRLAITGVDPAHGLELSERLRSAVGVASTYVVDAGLDRWSRPSDHLLVGVLGAGSRELIEEWSRMAASVPGYVSFRNDGVSSYDVLLLTGAEVLPRVAAATSLHARLLLVFNVPAVVVADLPEAIARAARSLGAGIWAAMNDHVESGLDVLRHLARALADNSPLDIAVATGARLVVGHPAVVEPEITAGDDRAIITGSVGPSFGDPDQWLREFDPGPPAPEQDAETSSRDEQGGNDRPGGGDDSAPWQPPAGETDEFEEPDTIDTFLNAELDNGDEPLHVDRPYTLAVSFGDRSPASTGAIVVPTAIPIGKAEETVDVEVQVVSSHFDVPRFPQHLRVKRDGQSMGRALFEVTPLPKDPTDDTDSPFWTLSVLVSVNGNHLQRLDLTYDLEPDASGADVESFTRGGLTGATTLRERVATLQIKPTGWGYELIAPLSPHPQPHKILVTPPELDTFIGKVRSALLRSVREESVALQMELTDRDNLSLLNDLALAGYELYQLLFEGDNATDDLIEVGDWLREMLARPDVPTLQVVSDGFPVPWPLLYPAKGWNPASVSWDTFIGMQCVVEQLPLTNPTRDVPSPTIDSFPELSVRVLFNDSIDEHIPMKPLAEQRRYWAGAGVALRAGTKADDLVFEALGATADDKVLYLYCHATSRSKEPGESKIIFTGEAVSLQQLRNSAPRRDQLRGHPLIFINACESADLTPQFYGGFVPYFLGKGARGVIGTECKVPGLFASEWAKAFFDELFAGKALGEVVLTLRRRFLADYNNPLGLLYGVHCDADTIIAPAISKPA